MTGQLCREGAEEGLAKVHVDVGVNERPAPESDTPAVIASLLWQSHSSVTESRTNNRDNRRSVRCCTVSLGLLAGIIAVFESNLLHFRADEFGVAFRKNLERSITLYLLTGNKSVEDSIPPTSIRNIKTGHNTNEKIYVVTLQGVPNAHPANRKRLDAFIQAWNATCGQPPIVEICPGNVDTRRGYGITTAYIACFHRAINDAQPNPIFLEDAARLSGTALCAGKDWKDLPRDAFFVLLGGHHWKYGKKRFKGYRQTLKSFGAYGFVVPRRHLKALAAGYAKDLQSGSETLSPDKSWYDHAKRARQHVYALDPLLVYHPAGYSNTWSTMRGIIPTNNTSIGGRGWRTRTRKRRRRKSQQHLWARPSSKPLSN